MLEDRTVDVVWNDNSNKRYLVCLLVYSNDGENHMLDIVQTISMMNINVEGIKILNRGNTTTYEVECYVTGLEQLNKLILTVTKHKYIDKVERAMK